MGLARYIEGVLLSAVCVGAALLGARRLRRRVLPGWTGAPGWVADAIITIALFVAVLEVIGIVGLFDLTAAVVACVAGGVVLWTVGGRIQSDRARVPASFPQPAPPSTAERVCVAVAIAAVAAPWIGWTIFSYRHGMQTPDTLWYHLPQAARFVQVGNLLHLQYFDSDPVTVFYPANAELFHALGLMLFGSDLLSPAINLGWAALALVAAWAIGRRYARGAHCLIAALLLLGTPALIDTQPGGAYNDVTCIALFLSAVAVLVNGGLSPGPSAVAAIAAGLALGTKFTMIVPAFALAAGVVVVTARGARLRQTAVWAAALGLLGGYWYLRDAVATGTPVPAISIHLGPLSLTAPNVAEPTFTVGQYLTNGHVWSAFYLPGLHQAFGPAWAAIIVFAATGAIGALVTRQDRLLAMLGGVAVICAAAYVITPQFLGFAGAPVFFVYNLRYAAVPIVLGLVLAPLLPVVRSARAGTVWLGASALTLLATELDPGVWPSGVGGTPFSTPIHGGPAIAGTVAGILMLLGALTWPYLTTRVGRLWSRGRVVARTVAVGALGAATICGWLVADSYARNRYVAASPIPRVFNWARSVRHARIAIVGIVAQYPLYGSDASNYVQYVGRSEAHGGFGSIKDCRDWRRAIDHGHYGWLLIAPYAFPLTNQPAPELAWTESTPGAVRVIDERATNGPPNDSAVLFRITGSLDPGTC